MIAVLAFYWIAILVLGWIVCYFADKLPDDDIEGNGRRTPEDPWEWTWID